MLQNSPIGPSGHFPRKWGKAQSVAAPASNSSPVDGGGVSEADGGGA